MDHGDIVKACISSEGGMTDSEGWLHKVFCADEVAWFGGCESPIPDDFAFARQLIAHRHRFLAGHPPSEVSCTIEMPTPRDVRRLTELLMLTHVQGRQRKTSQTLMVGSARTHSYPPQKNQPSLGGRRLTNAPPIPCCISCRNFADAGSSTQQEPPYPAKSEEKR